MTEQSAEYPIHSPRVQAAANVLTNYGPVLSANLDALAALSFTLETQTDMGLQMLAVHESVAGKLAEATFLSTIGLGLNIDEHELFSRSVCDLVGAQLMEAHLKHGSGREFADTACHMFERAFLYRFGRLLLDSAPAPEEQQ